MKKFEYTITDPVGIHARPAAILVKAVSAYKSHIEIARDEKSIDAKKLMAVMGLGIKCGERIIFTIEGEDEEAAAVQLEKFCRNNL